jgi:hypothetical protein
MHSIFPDILLTTTSPSTFLKQRLVVRRRSSAPLRHSRLAGPVIRHTSNAHHMDSSTLPHWLKRSFGETFRSATIRSHV